MEKDSTIARLLEPWAKAEQIRIERKAVYRFHARVCKRFVVFACAWREGAGLVVRAARIG